MTLAASIPVPVRCHAGLVASYSTAQAKLGQEAGSTSEPQRLDNLAQLTSGVPPRRWLSTKAVV